VKRLVTTLTVLIFLVCPTVGFSDYVIHLKNGRKIQTTQYWEKGEQILFYLSGQTVGIEKQSVERIETLPLSGNTGSSGEARTPSVESVEKPPAETLPKDLPSASDENPESQMILKEFSQIKNRFQTLDKMTTRELHAFVTDLTAFRDNILANRLGHIYDKQLLETTEMGNKIEDLLKTRDQ